MLGTTVKPDNFIGRYFRRLEFDSIRQRWCFLRCRGWAEMDGVRPDSTVSKSWALTWGLGDGKNDQRLLYWTCEMKPYEQDPRACGGLTESGSRGRMKLNRDGIERHSNANGSHRFLIEGLFLHLLWPAEVCQHHLHRRTTKRGSRKKNSTTVRLLLLFLLYLDFGLAVLIRLSFV